MINVALQSLSFPLLQSSVEDAKHLAYVRSHTCLTKGSDH